VVLIDTVGLKCITVSSSLKPLASVIVTEYVAMVLLVELPTGLSFIVEVVSPVLHK